MNGEPVTRPRGTITSVLRDLRERSGLVLCPEFPFAGLGSRSNGVIVAFVQVP